MDVGNEQHDLPRFHVQTLLELTEKPNYSPGFTVRSLSSGCSGDPINDNGLLKSAAISTTVSNTWSTWELRLHEARPRLY